jgi:hypothetical protein
MQVPNIKLEQTKAKVKLFFVCSLMMLHALGIWYCVLNLLNGTDPTNRFISAMGIPFILNGAWVVLKMSRENKDSPLCKQNRILNGYQGRVWSLMHVRELTQYLMFRFTIDHYLRRAVFATACLKGPKHPTEPVLTQGFYLLNKSITQMHSVRSELQCLLLFGNNASPGWHGYCHIHILLGQLTKVQTTIRRFKSLKIDWSTIDHDLTITPEMLQHYFTVIDDLTAYATYVYLRSATYVRVPCHA